MSLSKHTRRQFVAGAAALPFAARAFASPSPSHAPKWVFLGSDKGKGIYRAPWNAQTGELGAAELAVETLRPTYLALHPRLPVLYAANEAKPGGGISSFRVHAAQGELTALNQMDSHGAGACYVSVDHQDRNAFLANYNSGSLAAYSLSADGSLLSAVATFDCPGNAACGPLGPSKPRQDAPHMHCSVVSPDNRFLLVCDLGSDAIQVFPLDTLLSKPVRVATRAGSGPRHVAFHPNGRWLFCIHELDCTLDLYDWHDGRLTLREGSIVSTLAPNAALTGSTACELLLSDDGRFLYANTRGANTLAVYRVDSKTGLLTEQQRVDTGGNVTRHIAFDPSRRWLLCSNQGSSTVTVFAHDPKSGELSATPKTFPAETPMFIQFAQFV
jgi:6-phosphogluconolactonase